MKKFSLVFGYVTSALVALVALAFTVLEATLLVTLDFTLYEDQFIACIQLVLRLLIASAALALGVSALIKSERSFLPHSLCLLASTAVMIPFVSNHVGLYSTIVAALFVLSRLLAARMRAQGAGELAAGEQSSLERALLQPTTPCNLHDFML